MLIEAKIFQEIFLSSDSEEYLKIGRANYIKTIKRPKKYSSDNATSESVISHFLNFLKYNKIELPEIIFIIQPTSPFVNIETFKKALRIYKNFDAGSVVSVIKTPHKYHFQNQRLILKNNVAKFLFKKTSSLRQNKIETFVHGNLFSVRTSEFIKQKKILAKPVHTIKLKNSWESLDIDVFEELKLARIIIKNIKNL